MELKKLEGAKEMEFGKLEKGKFYGDRVTFNVYQFVNMYNDQIAEFSECEYDGKKGRFFANNNIIKLVKCEVARLIKL